MSDDENDDTMVDISGEAPPMFRIVSRGALSLVDQSLAGVRPCDHRGFILDKKFNSVVCADCKEKIDPFAVLLLHAKYFEQLERRRLSAEHAEWNMIGQRIRGLLDRVCFTDAERDDIRRRTYVYGKGSLKDIRDLQKVVIDRVNDAKQQRARRVVARENAPTEPKRVP